KADREGTLSIELTGEVERIQRREFVRVDAHVTVNVRGVDEPLGGETVTLDISGGGLRISDPWELPLGLDVRVELQLPDGEPVRARASLIVFVLVLLFGHKAGLSWFDATWRALVAGLAANVIAWRCAIYIWRQMIVAELRRAEEIYADRRRQAMQTLEKRRAQ